MDEDELLALLRTAETADLKVTGYHGVWTVTDPESGTEYIVKRVAADEASMTRRAAEFGGNLPSDSNLRVPQVYGDFGDNLPGDISERFGVPEFSPESDRLIVMEALPIPDTSGPGQTTFTLLDRYSRNNDGALHPALGGQPITDAEFDILLRDVEAMNRAGITHHDLGSNMFVHRSEDGSLHFLTVDFDPAVPPIPGNSIQFDDVEQLRAVRERFQDSDFFETATNRTTNPAEVVGRPHLGTGGEADAVPDVDADVRPTTTGDGVQPRVIPENPSDRTTGQSGGDEVTRVDGDATAGNPLSDNDVNPQRDGDVTPRTGNDIPPEGGNNQNPQNGVDPNPSSDIDANQRSGEITPNQQGDRPSLTEEFRRADTGPNVQVDAPDAPTLPQGADGSGTTSPLRAASDAGDTADALPPSKWRTAVDGVGGGADAVTPRGGGRFSGLASHAAGGAGFALSAFHLKSQLLDDNSTFYRDLENEDVDGRAITALSLDATAFVADSVVIGSSALQASRALRAADSLADVARLGSGLSSASKFARVAGPVGLGITVVTTGLEYSIAETTEDGRRAGQAVGAGGGALGGAAIGAGLTWWLGPGAGVGAAVGGLIGAFGGGYAGGEYLDDDFQEYFDENALAEQRRNLDELRGIGENLEDFIRLEDEVAAAYTQLERRFEAINTEGMSEEQILAITPAQRSALEDAARAYEEKRSELAQNVQGAYLSSDDEQTLSDVQEFIQDRYAFLDMKEARLTEAGDAEALERLARDRAGLEAAHESITRLQRTNEQLGESYGENQGEVERTSTQNVASIWQAVRAQNEHVESYQGYIHTTQANEAQHEFEGGLERRLGRVNNSYNGGQTDTALMQRSAVLMGFVISGELDPSTLTEAKAEIEALQQEHQSELSGLRSSRASLRRMTREQSDLREDEYSGDFARHNLRTLRVVNERVSDLVQTHEMTQEIAGHAMGAAESTMEIQNLTGQLYADFDAGMDALIMGTDSMHTGVSDERQSAIYQIKSDIVEHSIQVSEHSGAILSLIGADMHARLDDIQNNLTDEREKAVPNTDTLHALGEVSEALVQVAQIKVTEISAYQGSIRDMLDNGVSIEGERFAIVPEDERQRLETVLQEMDALKTLYETEIAETREQVNLAETDIQSRVLEQDGVSVTLDHSGYVSSYSVEDETRRFRGDQRPMLVDHDGNIYNNTSELSLVDMNLALFSRQDTITQMGEPYQSYWRPDRTQLHTIEDTEEREQVRVQESDLVEMLKRKDIDDAVSAPPTVAENGQGIESNSIMLDEDSVQPDTLVLNDPAYIEVAIAMEKIRLGETLDSIEQSNIRDILADPSTAHDVISNLQDEYPDEMESLQQDAQTQTEGSGMVPVQHSNDSPRSLNF